jgi:hypothetical protein
MFVLQKIEFPDKGYTLSELAAIYQQYKSHVSQAIMYKDIRQFLKQIGKIKRGPCLYTKII